MTSAVWPLLPSPCSATGGAPVVTHADTGRSLSVGFSGRGLLMPFRRDRKLDFSAGVGVELTRSAVALVLGTIAGSESSQGELPWRTEFGSLLHLLRLRANSPALAELARSRIAQALARWVPTVRLRRVEVFTRGEALRLNIAYDVMDVSGERVLVPGLETSVALG